MTPLRLDIAMQKLPYLALEHQLQTMTRRAGGRQHPLIGLNFFGPTPGCNKSVTRDARVTAQRLRLVAYSRLVRYNAYKTIAVCGSMNGRISTGK